MGCGISETVLVWNAIPGKALEFLRCSSYSTKLLSCALACSSHFQNVVAVNETICEMDN